MPTLILRNPKFGDTVSTDFRQKNRRNLGGILNTVRPSTWPVIDAFHIVVEALSEVEKDDVMAFCVTNRGQEVTLKDYTGCIWTGIIFDPRFEQVGIGCQFQVSLTLEGTFTPPKQP